MADNSGSGALGVLVGALVVIVLGFAVLFATGTIGGKQSAGVNITLPKVSNSK